jgi:hypothetical protein
VKRWIWHARRMYELLGRHGAAGLLLFSTGVVLTALIAPAQRARLDAARTELGTLRARHMLAGPSGAKPARAEQLAAFYGYFPALETLPDWLARIYEAAQRNGVALEVGDYRMTQEESSRLARYQVTLPVRGGYGQIRAFIADVLNTVPAAALEEVAFKRDRISVPTLEARLRFAVYLERK